MSTSDFIKELLNIQADNLTIESAHKRKEHNQTVNVLVGTLEFEGKTCPCGGKIINWGYTNTECLILSINGYKSVIDLKKQRVRCQKCGKTEVASAPFIDKHCAMSKDVPKKILQLLKRRIAMTEIANLLDVSIATVKRVLESVSFNKPKHLPKALSFDENHMTKDMTFVMSDAVTHELLDLVEERSIESLKAYFYQIPYKERAKVQFITIDMYPPYMTLIRALFPNAKIVLDRFHIVQLLNRAFNKTRIQVMKDYDTKSKTYRHLKSCWKLLQRNILKLSTKTRYQRTHRSYLSQFEIVMQLIESDERLAKAYKCYQDALFFITEKDSDSLLSYLKACQEDQGEYLQTAIESILKYKEYVSNALKYPYSNGGIECLNNHLKVIKRLSYGFGSFRNLRNRAFLVLRNS